MIEWSETHQSIREMVRRFVEAEVKPHVKDLEHGDMPPYDILRKMLSTFGMRDMAEVRVAKARNRAEKRAVARLEGKEPPAEEKVESGEQVAMQMLPVIELSRFCPGMVTALGVSVGLTAATIMSRAGIRAA